MIISASLTADRLLDAAEAIVQRLGYAGLSFRDLAEAVGIRSASVHYHFPTKGDLGCALARRYTDRLAQHLERLSATLPPRLALAGYVDVFRTVFRQDGRMCLCGMLAAEADAIPPGMRDEVRRFITMNLNWITRTLIAVGDEAAPHERAMLVFASLEGALLLARATGDAAVFDALERRLPGCEA